MINKALPPAITMPPNQKHAASASPTTKSFESNFAVEQIIPGVYLSSSNEYWTPQMLRSHGFTHIIHIDKNVDYPDTVANNNNSPNPGSPTTNHATDFETLDLNFGGETYLAAVLPNLYKAVKFIDKALMNGGAIIVFDSVGYQKCVTVVSGYLMFKHNLNFSTAYELIKTCLSHVELDKFYVTQLYEYEPILQVHKTQMRGHSCSGELKRASLKRKKTYDDLRPLVEHSSTLMCTPPHPYTRNIVSCSNTNSETDVMEQ